MHVDLRFCAVCVCLCVYVCVSRLSYYRLAQCVTMAQHNTVQGRCLTVSYCTTHKLVLIQHVYNRKYIFGVTTTTEESLASVVRCVHVSVGTNSSELITDVALIVSL